eukprot:CAMPEP_0201523442 /NCGR_PEP_ID=MMETSP0161_2-20130828/19880_1 /ASSEMBLY_ACC=CAM_ASM_000251 /TAXON_ID=180227 /ORGANISM="Neoparamoeba aestuarina, Strain SoJaBio B1-5/56/2" /LENGTH=385 /DNA_ID=CAMNT_0047922557 /DNA_START=196 /DNA_END=1353 /DNA_ORIENTATION=+
MTAPPPSNDETINNDNSILNSSQDDMPKRPPPGIFLHRDAKFSKLVPGTKEDRFHIHKTLGFLSLCSFFYRYFYCYLKDGNLGFNGPDSPTAWFDWVSMAVHICLAFSSILFRVPKKRIMHKPMVIYEEYRQHAMVFCSRCLAVFSICYLFPSAPSYCVPLAVMAHHLLADRITNLWGTPNHTAVRANAARADTSKDFYRHIAKFYSLYQFLAIASHILPNERLADLGFNALIAIQSSAFMMTLYRKRIVRGRTHLTVYSLCLVISAFHIVRLIGLSVTLLTILTFLIRVNLPRNLSNKYVVWSFFLLAAHNWSDCVVYLSDKLGLEMLSSLSSSSSHLFSSFLPSSTSTLVDSLGMPVMKGSGLALLLYSAFWIESLRFKEKTL